MATVFCTFDLEGEITNQIVVPENVDLATVIHYSNYSYAYHAESMSEEDIDDAVEVLVQTRVIDYKNGVRP